MTIKQKSYAAQAKHLWGKPALLTARSENASCHPARYFWGKRPLLRPFLLASASVFLFTGCVVYRTPPPPPVVAVAPAPTEVVVAAAPPPPVQEVVTVAPAVGFVWIAGGWAWEGRWVWEGGHWTRPPYRGAVWVPHRYVWRNGAHVFVRGGWR